MTAVIDLGVGAPDIETPRVAADAATRAVAEGRTRYAGASGIPELRAAVSAYFGRAKGMTVDPANVFVSAGAKLTLFCILHALRRPGANIVVATPHYGGYPRLAALADLECREVPTRPEDGYRIDPGALAAAVDSDTVAVMLNAPSNPTGTTYTRAELEAIVDVVLRRSSAYVVSDEIYSLFSYDDAYVSAGSLDGIADRVIVVDGVSKAFGMSGWRIGYASGPAAVIDVAKRVNSQLTNCASTISQWAAVAALDGAGDDHLDLARHRRKRDAAYARASALPHATVTKPSGGIYQAIQLDDHAIAALTRDDAALTDSLRRLSGVRVPTDATFGRPGLLRVTFSIPDHDIDEGFRRLDHALASV